MSSTPVTTLFLDIGGVLLTNAWDRAARKRAAETFHLDFEEMNERHHLTFDTYEQGKLSLDEYLNRVVFHEKRDFAPRQFREFMFQQSGSHPRMIDLIRDIESQHNLKVVAVSNEGRELTVYRSEKFKLGSVIDLFVVSSYVHFRKPDADIFRIALDIAQVPPPNVFYIDDRAMFVEAARTLGIRGVRHTDVDQTRAVLASVGLTPKD